MATTQAELESLNTAIKLEKDGRAFYQEAVQRVANPLAKNVFETLADEELVHIETIQAFYDSLRETGSCEEAESRLAKTEDPQARLKNVFQKARQHMDQEVKADAGSLAAYEKAMKLEQAAYDMYQRLLEDTADSMARKLYEFMLDQENEHYAFLKETHDYLENPEDWYIREERPHFEG
jgi:rubrerythrin